ncbi:nucleotidyltransferase family protein [bacterium]|nr:nucleotidyltransferase family protein [bacterium]
MKNSAVIFLAAGESKRFGSPKLSFELLGKPLIFHTILPFVKAGFTKLFAVVGEENKTIEKVCAELNVTLIRNLNFRSGMNDSVVCGLEQTSGYGTFCVLPADQPFIQNQTLTMLYNRFVQEKCEILIPKFQAKKGHPVFFTKKVRDKILSLEGDFRLRRGLGEFKEQTCFFEVKDCFVAFDIDTLEDLEKAKLILVE